MKKITFESLRPIVPCTGQRYNPVHTLIQNEKYRRIIEKHINKLITNSRLISYWINKDGNKVEEPQDLATVFYIDNLQNEIFIQNSIYYGGDGS